VVLAGWTLLGVALVVWATEPARPTPLRLEPAQWNGTPGGWRYTGTHFVLHSNAPEELVRRSAGRLEQIYAAYIKLLPPRHPTGTRVGIWLARSAEDFTRWTGVQNRGLFDPVHNRILCASDLDRLADDLERSRQAHRQLRADLDQQTALVRKLFKGAELSERLLALDETRQRLAQADARNDATFDQFTRQLFSTLYHEAFHAYVEHFVYPTVPGEQVSAQRPGALPRWLNEGLALLFETATLGPDGFVLGIAAERREKLQLAVREGDVLSLSELLKADARAYQMLTAGDRAQAERHYLAAWGLALHLTRERKVLGTPALDACVASINRGGDPRTALATLVGQPLADYERTLRRYWADLPER
jgi:hypothetical protein